MQSACFADFRRVIAEWNAMLIRTAMIETQSQARDVLLKNLLDELAHGDPDGYHVNTFASFAATHCQQPCTHESHPGTQTFIAQLQNLHCKDTHYRYAYMATIELLYQKFSADVCAQLSGSGSKLAHFQEHAVLDQEHAAELYALSHADTIGHAAGVQDATNHFRAMMADY